MKKRTGYISEETKDAVRSILEATVEQNRWANLGVSQDHPDNTIDVFDKNEIDMAIERLPAMFHSSPVKMHLVEESFDIIATIKLDNKTGSIISAEPNGPSNSPLISIRFL